MNHSSPLMILALSLRSLALLLALAGVARAQIVYVDVSASGANSGTSWADAYVDLQPALLATNSGQIWVAAGTYYAGPSGNQFDTFQLRNGVAMYGGFAGTETAVGQRNLQANITTLSGDIDQNDTYGSGLQWWRFGWNGNAGNSYHIVTGSGTDATAVLDGFLIFAGLGGDPAARGGAGLLVTSGSPTLRNCTIQYCALGYGSSARLTDCNSTFENCVIRDGYTCNCGSGGWTSGVICLGTSSVTFTACEFLNHYYVSSMNQGRGAALRVDFNCSCTLLGCRFEGNQTGNFFAIGGGTARGGAVNSSGTLVVDRCEFVDNFAHAGAGIAASGPLTLTNSLFARNTAVPHAETSQLTYGDYGAGLLLWGFGAQPTVITNCTFVDNDCDKGGGIANYRVGTAAVTNCILYHNWGPTPLPGEDPVFILKRQVVGSVDLVNCCVEGLFQTEVGEDPPQAANFPGCFDVDPRLANVAGSDYHATPLSSCINTGDDSAVPAGLTVDLEGNPRIIGHVDMGCYEFSGTAGPSLFSHNLVQNFTADFSVVNAAPGELVFFLYSFAGVGAGPCLPAPATLCTDLLMPLGVLSWVTADGAGRGCTSLYIPQNAPLIDLHFQAAMFRGTGAVDSVATNTLSWTINAEP